MMGDLLMRHKPRPWPPLYRPSPEYPGLKGRDYYFFSPPWRGALAGPARGTSGRCGCARPRSLSRSMEDVRGAEVFEGPARRGPSLPLPPSARRSAENLLDQSFQVWFICCHCTIAIGGFADVVGTSASMRSPE